MSPIALPDFESMTWHPAGDLSHPLPPSFLPPRFVQTSSLRSVHTSALHHSAFTLHIIAHFPTVCLFLPNLLCFQFLLPNPPLSLSCCFTTCLAILYFLFSSYLSLCTTEFPVIFLFLLFPLLSYSRPTCVLPLL